MRIVDRLGMAGAHGVARCLALISVLGVPVTASAEWLYVVRGDTLVSVNPGDGQQEEIATGLSGTSLLTSANDALYGIDDDDLYRVDLGGVRTNIANQWAGTNGLTSSPHWLFGLYHEHVYKTDPATGAWSTVSGNFAGTKLIAWAGGALMVVQNNKLYRVNPSNGSYSTLPYGYSGTTAIAGADDYLYVLQNSVLYRVDTQTGAYLKLASISGTPRLMAALHGAVYVVRGSQLLKFDPSSGAMLQMPGNFGAATALSRGPDLPPPPPVCVEPKTQCVGFGITGPVDYTMDPCSPVVCAARSNAEVLAQQRYALSCQAAGGEVSECSCGVIVCSKDVPAPKVVFVSSTARPSADLGGLAGADATCATLASNAGLTGSFKAFMSDASASAATRLNAANLPYVLPDGTPVASSFSDLLDGSLEHPIDVDETGFDFGANTVEVWTGSYPNGTPSGASCQNWSNSRNSDWTATVGLSSEAGGMWSQAYSQFCDRDNVHLYCVEQ